jgi:hypothetical protein
VTLTPDVLGTANCPPSGNVPENCHPILRRGIAYWHAIHPPEGLPGRQHLDPVDIPDLLPHMRLVDVEGDPPRFRVRLVGSQIVAFFGQDLTGRWYHEEFDSFFGSRTEKDFVASMRTHQPSWRRGNPLFVSGKDFRITERVFLPFARDGREVDMFLNLVVFL